MCRMIAKISVAPASILEEMLQCPYSLSYLSEQGRQPENPERRGRHSDGCGMAFSKDGTVEVHKRSRENVWDTSYQELARNTVSRIFLAHNRLASQGLEVTSDGAHPFSVTAAGQTFALCHNGSVRTYMEAAKKEHTSDSFLLLRKLINPAGKNDADSIYDRLSDIARNTDYSSLCAMLISQDELYVWRKYSQQNPENSPRYEKYYTVYMMLRSGSAVFSSEPLDDRPWLLLENNTFLHLKIVDAKLVMEYRRI